MATGSIPKRLVGPKLVDSTPEDSYTVAANRRAIIRHIHISNPTGGAVTYKVGIGDDTAAPNLRILDGQSVAAGAVFDHFGYYVLAAAEKIFCTASADDTTTITISGEEAALT
jgi:hypothetical protein